MQQERQSEERPDNGERTDSCRRIAKSQLLITEGLLPVFLELIDNLVGQPRLPTGRFLCAPDQFLRVAVHEPNLCINYPYNNL